MLTKVLSASVLKIGFCQLKRLLWDILVTEVYLPGEKSLCAHSINRHISMLSHVPLKGKYPFPVFKPKNPGWSHLAYFFLGVVRCPGRRLS